MTGEDLGLNPSTVEKAQFECSPLGKTFNKGLDKDEDKKEGLWKRLKILKAKMKNSIKPTLLKIIYNQKMKDKNINNDEAKK